MDALLTEYCDAFVGPSGEPQYLAIPRMDDALDAVGQIQPNYISALDLMMAFIQLSCLMLSAD